MRGYRVGKSYVCGGCEESAWRRFEGGWMGTRSFDAMFLFLGVHDMWSLEMGVVRHAYIGRYGR